MRSIFIGYDARESEAFAIARYSLIKTTNRPMRVSGLFLQDLRDKGIYTRPTSKRIVNGVEVMWDDLSDAPMSTDHACARFLVPFIANRGWALFTDGDVLFRDDIHKAFDYLDERYAVYCVKHDHRPAEQTKMDGQVQQQYSRKNWSSVMFFNVGHPANDSLTIEHVNTLPGRDLHRFCWLEDSEIGELHPRWNNLVGHNFDPDPAIVHYTSGVPNMPGYENCDWSDEWFDVRRQWIMGSGKEWVTGTKSSRLALPRAPQQKASA